MHKKKALYLNVLREKKRHILLYAQHSYDNGKHVRLEQN